MKDLSALLRDVGSYAKENFAQVNEWLYRGGDPTKTLMPDLQASQIKTVLSLRHRDSIRKAERDFLDDYGMKLIEVPMTYQSMQEDEIARALDAIRQAKRNVYVHCDHGKDRTGIVICAFRVIEERWQWKDARKEMIEMGFHPYRLYLMERRLQNYLKSQNAL